jgi:hypothetical protein
LSEIVYTTEDRNDTHADFRKIVIDLFNEKIKLCDLAQYRPHMCRQEILSFGNYLNRVVQEILDRAHKVLETG